MKSAAPHPYACSKLAAEALAHTWHHWYGINAVVLRYFTVYGPAGRPDMSPFRFSEWIRRGEPITLYGDGNQTRDFTYIDDIARGTLMALNVPGFEIINLGGGNEPLSINSMIAMLEEYLGRPAVIDRQQAVAADMPHTSADIGKAAELLGWRPATPPPDGLARTAQWHLGNASWLNEIRL